MEDDRVGTDPRAYRTRGKRVLLTDPAVRAAFVASLLDLFLTAIFPLLPDDRESDGGQLGAIFVHSCAALLCTAMPPASSALTPHQAQLQYATAGSLLPDVLA